MTFSTHAAASQNERRAVLSTASEQAACPHENGQLELALATAEDGYPVHPVCPHTKRPLTLHGFKDATTDVAQIIQWWNRWPHALVSVPTGHDTGLAVLDIDIGGEQAFNGLLARWGLELADDLSSVSAITPSGGRHFYFCLEAGTEPKSRASDIARNIDSRAVGGSILIPGNMRPDGRSYRWGSSGRLHDVQPLPRDLCYLMTFGKTDRRLIMDTPELKEAMRLVPAAQWLPEMQAFYDRQRARIAERIKHLPPDADDMRRQALHDLHLAAAEYAGLEDGRRNKLFTLACSVGKYVAHSVLTEAEFRSTFIDAARANGALQKHGYNWASKTIHNALNRSQADALPPLAREFRTMGDAA